MIFQTTPKNKDKWDDVQICFDPQYLIWQSRSISNFLSFYLFSLYSIVLAGSVPTIKSDCDEASMMEHSKSRARVDTGARTENGIYITLLSVKLSQWKRLYPPFGP